jgi:hypothetical protein
LETPEHSGRVRGVGSFISPSSFFDIPRTKRNMITKAELLARDIKREEEFEKKTRDFESQINELRGLITASNIHSPMMSDKASCPGKEYGEKEVDDQIKPKIAKELIMGNEEDTCVRKCEMSVGRIENKVAFGVVFEEGANMAQTVHGKKLQPGHVRVSVDGIIKDGKDALVPVPVPDEIETVQQAIGSHLAWPRDMITYTSFPAVNDKV